MKTKLIDLLGLTNMANDIRDWVNAHFQRKVDGKGLSTYDYDKTAKDKVDAIPADPKYTDTTYEAGDGISIENNVISATGGGGGGEENVIEAITMNGASVPVTNKTAAITETDPTVPSWAKQPNKPSYNYSEIGNTPDLSGFVTKSVNDLTNYYLKSETYTQTEVNALIGAIQQFHYEIYDSLPKAGESNVLYLIGPTGSGSDKYEEYIYTRNTWTKIGDTSIDLSGYVTTSALNTALASYTPTSSLATVAISGSYNDLTNTPTIPTVPTNVSAFNNDAGYLTQHQSLADYVQKSQTAGLLKNDGTVDTTSYGTYSKPSGGIPATDIASGVIPTVPTALSSFTDDLGSSPTHTHSQYLTSHQDISGKADKVVYVDASTPPSTMDSNKVYQYGTLSGDTTFPAFTAVSSGDTEVKIWCWTFTTPSTAPTITWPAGITAWNGGSAPTINASKSYEVSVMDGLACIIES